jgi:hypothetical protein
MGCKIFQNGIQVRSLSALLKSPVNTSTTITCHGILDITTDSAVMSRLFISLALVSILVHSDAFRQTSFRHNAIRSKRVTELADFSALHDTGILASSIDAFHHVFNGLSNTDVHALQNSFTLADADVTAIAPPVASAVPDAAVSIYSKVDKTGFIGACADILERAIDLSHDLMQKLGVKDTYGFSIILLTIFSKFVTLLMI